jgi:hypothetical protein
MFLDVFLLFITPSKEKNETKIPIVFNLYKSIITIILYIL